MQEKIMKEKNMFKNIMEILVNKKIDELISVTMFYDEKREEIMSLTFLCNGKEETFAVYPQHED